MSSDNFTYVVIPADPDQPIEEQQASKSGGLENDELIAAARDYFGKQALTDITPLTIPNAANQYHAVSLYHSPDSSKAANKRATALVVGCGLSGITIVGDAFVGRAVDHEVMDEDEDVDDGRWERVDFTAADADPAAEWCQQQRQQTSGQRSGTSMSSILQQQLGGNNTHVFQPPPVPDDDMFGMDGNRVVESWGSWSQSNDGEVELQFPVPEGTKSKDVQVTFGRQKVSVNIHKEQTLCGATFAPIDVDECTFTIVHNEDKGQKEVCVSLAKANPIITWSYAVLEPK